MVSELCLGSMTFGRALAEEEPRGIVLDKTLRVRRFVSDLPDDCGLRAVMGHLAARFL